MTKIKTKTCKGFSKTWHSGIIKSKCSNTTVNTYCDSCNKTYNDFYNMLNFFKLR